MLLGHVLFLGEGKAREGGIPPTGLFVGGVTGRPQKSPFRTPVQKGSFAEARARERLKGVTVKKVFVTNRFPVWMELVRSSYIRDIGKVRSVRTMASMGSEGSPRALPHACINKLLLQQQSLPR